jgi:hypothetical protein
MSGGKRRKTGPLDVSVSTLIHAEWAITPTSVRYLKGRLVPMARDLPTILRYVSTQVRPRHETNIGPGT